MRSHIFLAAFLVALSGGCDDLTGPFDHAVSFQVLEIRPGDSGGAAFVIQYQVENQGTETVYLTPRCGDSLNPVLYERREGSWAQVAGGFCPAVLDMSPWPLGPGERLVGSAGRDEEGTYQLRIETADEELEESVWIISDRFRLE